MSDFHKEITRPDDLIVSGSECYEQQPKEETFTEIDTDTLTP